MDNGKLAKTLRRRAKAAQDEMARKQFGWETVLKTIEAAAARGHGLAVIEPPVAVDLSRTEEAVSTVLRLRGDHCAADWVPSQKFTGSDAMALRVSWIEEKSATSADASNEALNDARKRH